MGGGLGASATTWMVSISIPYLCRTNKIVFTAGGAAHAAPRRPTATRRRPHVSTRGSSSTYRSLHSQTQSLTPQAPPLTLPQLARATPTSTLPPQLSPPSFTPPTYITYLSPPLPTAPCLPSYIPVPQPAATPLRPTRTPSFGCHSVSHLSHLSLTLAASAALR